MNFTNPDVAAKYEATFNKDKRVHVQGEGISYQGPISGITLAAADKLVADGDNQLRLKGDKQPSSGTPGGGEQDDEE